VFGRVVELQPAQQPPGLGRRKGLVERAGGMGREVIEDDPDLLGLGIMDIGKLAHAVGEVAGRAMVGDPGLRRGRLLTLRHGRWASRKTNAGEEFFALG
jgi:hypothetical protein